jgi:hypothetical protein
MMRMPCLPNTPIAIFIRKNQRSDVRKSLLYPVECNSIPRSIRSGRKRQFLIVFDSFGSHRTTAVFHRIVNERTRSDTPFSGRLRQYT